MMQFKLEKQAVKDLKFFKKNNVRLYKKCLQLIENIIESPENWIWKPEKLKYLSENFWSRRIDLEHSADFTMKMSSINFWSWY